MNRLNRLAELQRFPQDIMLLIIVVSFFCATTTESAASIQYQFRGQVPTGASTIADVGNLETWIATFVVDESVAASLSPFADSSLYSDAVVSGSLSFSGGYNSALDFAGYDIVVFNNADGSVDAVYIADVITAPVIGFQAVSDANPLLTMDLPLPVTTFSASPSVTSAGYLQLQYSDSNGEISYAASTVNNVSFAATDGSTGVIPEPLSIAVWAFLCLSFVGVRTR